MRVRATVLALCFLVLAASPRAPAAPLLHALFQDHAVLQRDRPIVVWGHAQPHETVTVTLAGASARAQADPTGRWSAILPAMAAGGPFILSAQGSAGSRQSAADLLVGDVGAARRRFQQ